MHNTVLYWEVILPESWQVQAFTHPVMTVQSNSTFCSSEGSAKAKDDNFDEV